MSESEVDIVQTCLKNFAAANLPITDSVEQLILALSQFHMLTGEDDLDEQEDILKKIALINEPRRNNNLLGPDDFEEDTANLKIITPRASKKDTLKEGDAAEPTDTGKKNAKKRDMHFLQPNLFSFVLIIFCHSLYNFIQYFFLISWEKLGKRLPNDILYHY